MSWRVERGILVNKVIVLFGIRFHCVMWLVWRVLNCRAFEGTKRITTELKMNLLHALFDWKEALHNLHSSSLLDFLDTCSFY